MSRLKFRIVVGPDSGRDDEPEEATTFDVVLYSRCNRDPMFSKDFEEEPTEELLNGGGEYAAESLLTLYPDEAWALISSLLASGAGKIESDDDATMNSVEYLRGKFSGDGEDDE